MIANEIMKVYAGLNVCFCLLNSMKPQKNVRHSVPIFYLLFSKIVFSKTEVKVKSIGIALNFKYKSKKNNTK